MKVSMHRRPVLATYALATLATAITFMPVAAQPAEKIDLDAIYKIKEVKPFNNLGMRTWTIRDPAAPIISRSMPWVCPASSSFRIRSNTTR